MLLGMVLLSTNALAAEYQSFTVEEGSTTLTFSFTNEEGLDTTFTVPFNKDYWWREGIGVKEGQNFIISRPHVQGGFLTHAFQLKSIDTTENQATFKDHATGTREVTMIEQTGTYQGELIVAGNRHRFTTDGMVMYIDFFGDGRIQKPHEGGNRYNFLGLFGKRALAIEDSDQFFFESEGERINIRIPLEVDIPLHNGKTTTATGINVHKQGNKLTISYPLATIQRDARDYPILCRDLRDHEMQDNCKEDLRAFRNGKPAGSRGVVGTQPRQFNHNGVQYEVTVMDTGATYVTFMVNGEVFTIKEQEIKTLATGAEFQWFSKHQGQAYVVLRHGKSAPQPEKKRQPIPDADDLSGYPDFFRVRGTNQLDVDLVVGDKAPGSHVVAAIDMVQSLQKSYPDSAIGAAKLASEVNTPGNMIVIGDACNNPWTGKITGNTDCHYSLQPGQGAIELHRFNGKTQIIVAGYDELETRTAARALSNWQGWKGTRFLVEGTLEDPIVMPAKHRKKQPPQPPKDENLSPPTFPTEDTEALPLKRGWNLVSLPGKLGRFTDNTCSKKPAAFVYLHEHDQYATLQEAARKLGGEFNTYLADYAFWVYSYDDCKQHVSVEEYEPRISLQQGWNLLPNAELSCDYDERFWWNAQTQEWSSMDTGNAQAVKTSEACEE